MVISLVVAHLWGVLQLILLASFARTVRVRTVYAALAAGLYLCAPVTAALQVALTRIVASSMDMSVPELVHVAGYTLDPFVEELAKILPLSLLLMVPLFKRQWSFTDCVLIGAATGAGFGLAEDLYRFGGSADHAQSIAGGWALVFSGDYLLVPGIGHMVTSWLPHGVGGSHDAARLNEHLIWSAVAGLAVGLTILARTTAARLTALGLYVCISLDHAAGNMSDISGSWLTYLAWPLRALTHVRALMPLAALAAAWWLDQQRQGTRVVFEPLLEAEQSGSSRLRGTLEAAFSRLPWSLIAVDRFVRMRRAARTEHLAARTVPLNAMLVNERDRVDRELAKWRTLMPALWPPGWSARALRAALRRPSVVLWLVIMTPSALYFFVGGSPQTAALQAFMLQPLVAKLLFPISVLAQAWISWRTIVGLRARALTLGVSIGDEAALVGLRVACGVGAVSLGVFSLLRMLGGLAPGASLLASLHAQSAADRLTPGAGSMLADGAGAFAPPPRTLELPDTGSGASSGAPSNSSGNASSNADGAGQSPSAAPRVPPPAPAPDPVAAAGARSDAAAADLADAQQRRLDAQSALESAQIKQATAAAGDPAVTAAEERARAAHDAADAADIKAADDFTDPWGEKSSNQAAADETRAGSHAADSARDDAVNAAQQRLNDDAQAAEAADQQANADVTAAEAKAGLAKADADAKAADAQSAAERNAAAQQKTADPKGFAADEAAKAAAAAQKRADDAFMDTGDPTGQAYHAANEAAQQARQQADAARAAADSATAGRESFATRGPSAGGKPFKP
jgi:RsiW-degrading membrane proteinase PrsW (M82 family)